MNYAGLLDGVQPLFDVNRGQWFAWEAVQGIAQIIKGYP